MVDWKRWFRSATPLVVDAEREISGPGQGSRPDDHIRAADRISIGTAGVEQEPGWLPTDQDTLNLTNRDTFARYWQPETRSAFLAEHVWEHLTPDDARTGARNCFAFLKPGGRLRIAVPDGYFPDPDYIEWVRPGGNGAGADDHKVLWTYDTFSPVLADAGFDVHLLEWWDEAGQFHTEPWSSGDGHISRSKAFDPRNQDGEIRYTSLIVDGIKPLR